MKTIYRLFFCAAAVLATLPAGAQKKPLDHSVYDSWQKVAGQALSADGTKVAYEVDPQEGDGTLYIKDLKSGAELAIERGSGISMTADSKWAFCRIKAPFQATRKAKIAKKKPDQMPKDTLAFINLTDLTVKKIADFTNYRVCKYGPYFTYETNAEIKAPKDTTKKAVSDSTKKAAKPAPAKKEKVLVFVNPDGFSHDTLRHVEGYSFSRAGDKMAVVFKKDKKDTLSKDEVCLYRLPSMEKVQLAEGKKFYSTPEFNAEGDRFVMLASNDSNATGTKNCSLILGSDKVVGKGKKATRQVTTEELAVESPLKGWVISTGSAPKFSTKSDRIYLDLRDYQAPKDTSIVEFEAARLDLWSWDIYTTPPMYKANRNRVNPLRAIINLNGDRKVHAIATTQFEGVSITEGGEGKYALVTDPTPYMIRRTWDENRLYDVYLVNLEDGTRETIRTAMNGGPGLSPEGKYIYWYSADDLGYHVMDLATRTEVNVTAATGVNFYDEEDDHPDVKPQTDGAHWLEGDEAFLLADKYDMWKFSPDGKKFECMTKGEGRRNNRVYRYIDVVPNDWAGADGAVGKRREIGRKELVYMTVFDRTTKGYGYATMKADQAGLVSEFVSPNMYPSFFRAYNVNVFAYQKCDCSHPSDLYVSDNLGVTEQQITSINPQQADYNWCNVQLVKWKAYDGTELQGLLYTPEDLDPTQKYPMMCYFYEKNSHTLHQYYSPAPSRSIICIPFYASRGYVVFVPDIVYKDGHPGESAYNCICSGAEAMCEQFSFIDKSKMAIQGQSWGGYQTAYLVTRTNMFAAAGAGAPVGNMTSAYGGIRWGSGAVRAMQYEHGQSRVGKSMWEEGGLDLYIENSPVFHTENVTTPVLIMHNDNDGAVPWYQGIEFFMSLRRFEKPAWLLEYNGEAHNLVERRNCKDLSIRLQQFFDHYLKGEPAPAWMVTGIPGTRKGQYYGFEQAEQ